MQIVLLIDRIIKMNILTDYFQWLKNLMELFFRDMEKC